MPVDDEDKNLEGFDLDTSSNEDGESEEEVASVPA